MSAETATIPLDAPGGGRIEHVSTVEVSGGSYPRREMRWASPSAPITWNMPTQEQILEGVEEDRQSRRAEIALEWLAEQDGLPSRAP